MAAAVRCLASSSWTRLRQNNYSSSRKNVKVSSKYSPSAGDPYKTLRIEPCASESDVKKAFRKLALQYHPDVCKRSDCGIQFHHIYEAYEIVMGRIREEAYPTNQTEIYEHYDDTDESVNDQDWDLWEEWMGWEGAGIRDYSSHINPYI